jgi:hypothetical protein
MLRKISVLGLGAILYSATISPLNAQLDLKRLSEEHQMFLLRDHLSGRSGTSGFYKGQVECAFNDARACQLTFDRLLAVYPRSSFAKEIHHILAYTALRQGQYARALREMDALLALDPQDSDAIGTRPFVKALTEFPDQAIEPRSADRIAVQMDGGKLPLWINGKRASYFFDTGANLSTMSASEAGRLGMEVREVRGSSFDVNGATVRFRIALARSLSIGGVVLNNVAFLVAGDDQHPFVDMEPGQRGLIGLPVLIALGSISWNPQGAFLVDRTTKLANMRASNLFFDDLMLITEAAFEHQELPFVVDTGAESTELWPKFSKVASKLISKSGSHESHSVTGVGGKREFDAITIPKVVLTLRGQPVALQPAHVLQTQQRSVGQWFFGNLGIDLLGKPRSVQIDFRTMTLRLSGKQ